MKAVIIVIANLTWFHSKSALPPSATFPLCKNNFLLMLVSLSIRLFDPCWALSCFTSLVLLKALIIHQV